MIANLNLSKRDFIMYKEKKYIQVFLILMMITSSYAEDMKEIKMTKYCFTSPYIFLFDTHANIINEVQEMNIMFQQL